jgi:hypothetical protein
MDVVAGTGVQTVAKWMEYVVDESYTYFTEKLGVEGGLRYFTPINPAIADNATTFIAHPCQL